MPTFRKPNRLRRLTVILVMLALTALTPAFACGGGNSSDAGSPTGDATMSTVQLQIQHVDILIAESSPPQVTARVIGIIPDSCTTAREPEISRDGSTITIKIIGERPDGVACAQIISSYEKSVALGSLDPGSYTLHVNNLTQVFGVS